MCKPKRSLLFFAFFACLFFRGYSQITASPSFTGCAPFSVVLSGPAGATNVFWNLGAGIGTSTISSPNPIYNSPGTYNITYTAVVAGTNVSYNQQIVVKASPTGNMAASIPQNHCAPMVVTFNGTGAPGISFIWTFGDLSSNGTGASVTHTYVNSNSYVPMLTVVDAATGCTATANSNVTVQVSSPPNLVISSSNGLSGCTPPFVTTINGSGSSSGSPLGGGLTYNWSFNNGSPSTSQAMNPGTVSFGAGQHTITLTATDNNQCSGTYTVPVSVVSPSIAPTIPATVCINRPVLGSVTANQSSLMMGDLGVGSYTNIAIIPSQLNVIDSVFFLTTPGTHTLVFIANPPGCPAFSVTQVVFVEQVVASFTWNPPVIFCDPTVALTYINTSSVNNSSSLTFSWSAFAPVNASHHGVPVSTVIAGMASPTFTFEQGSHNPYTIYQTFSPVVGLIAQSNSIAHCKSDISTIPYTIQRPTAWFYMDKKQGCAPLDVEFKDGSTTNAAFPITSYTWCNGATPPTFSIGTVTPPNAIPNYSFSYTNPGTYYPFLLIQTAGGCVDSSFIDTIKVVNPPQLTVSYPSTACAGQSVTINITATGSGGHAVDHYHVTTDNRYFSGCVTNPSPSFPFSHTGTHTVIASAYVLGCEKTVTLVPTIQIKGPYGKFQFETTCTGDKKQVKFYVNLQEATSAILKFGDNNQVAITGNGVGITNTVVTYTYLNRGDFIAQLVSSSSSSGCAPHTFTQTVKIREPQAIITYSGLPLASLPGAIACTKAPYRFSSANSIDVAPSCEAMTTWFFQSQSYTLAPLVLYTNFQTKIVPVPTTPPSTLYVCVDPIGMDTFRYAGTYTIGLMIKDENSCTDLTTKVFRISQAKPVFTLSPNPLCLSDGTVQVINGTQNSMIAPDLINSYKWTFGDGTPTITSTNPNSSPTHTYGYAVSPQQTFAVMCIATNTLGCTDTTTKIMQVNSPMPLFSANKVNVCLPKNQGATINFTANTGYSTYSVTYGEPPGQPVWTSSGTFNNASHYYSVPGTYTPQLSIVDNAGCKATQTLEINAIGQPTAAIFFPDGKTSYCRPAQPTAVCLSTLNTTPITNFIWTIGSISSAYPGNDTLIYSYTQPVTTLSLTVSVGNFALCPYTVTASVRTYSTAAIASITPTIFCLGDNVQSSIRILNDVYAWKWFYGDFVQQPIRYNTPITPTTVSYPYTTFPTASANGDATVSLYYYADGDFENGCKQIVSIPIHVIKVQSDFKHVSDTYFHCLKVPDSFTPTAVNFPELNLAYEWKYGNQDTARGLSPTYTYPLPGTYQVTLTVRDLDYGCKAVSVKNMTIFPLPSASITAVEITCPDTPFLITGQATPGVSGTVTGTLTPLMNTVLNFNPSNTFTATGSISQSSSIFVTVTDNNNCVNTSPTRSVFVQAAAPHISWDTTVVIGQPIPLNAFVGSGFSYTWANTSFLNCDTCLIYNPVSTSTVNITYSVNVEDGFQCSVVKNTYRVNIDIKVSIDVPTAFTPNGDGINDVIFPNGWGLKKLNYFKVFNRWGQLVFESNDLNIGWDGVFKGVPQNMETYVYQVSAETYLDSQSTVTKTGTFKLIR